MAKMLIAHYFSAEAQAPANASIPSFHPLKINNGEVKFLQPPLVQNQAFQMANDGLWRIEFFQQSEFQQTLWVKILEAQTTDSIEKIKNALKPSVAADGIKFTSNQTHGYGVFVIADLANIKPEEMITVSQVVRGSNALSTEQFTPFGNDAALFMDGKGFVFASSKGYRITGFKRQVLLSCLGKAYLSAIEKAIYQLADHCQDLNALRKLYRDSAVFNARYYFNQPVLSDRIELFPFWNKIRETLPIAEISLELRDQLDYVHRILDQEERVQSALQDKRVNQRITYIGLVIGLISLLTLIEITPAKVAAFFSGWLGLF
jgi:hypothetical protein